MSQLMRRVRLTWIALSHNHPVPTFKLGEKAHLTGVTLQYTKKSWKECNTL
jgi:hypothetical protein